ncbi:hypothetical gamma-tubulin complex [Klebsormidium nitens]|uniref:Hypothetical gamma-tubulin complex n=1 Tax=Klebsormidium nitens TaxID=105231 RepID=A0A1Y1I6D7_KLENI|nr:hypothetical gamma-tubulin complex [Klebsormidium nitens]|eukprot:GAQ84287.1 hypothetical gamma-tubulin complex [Klebsormidium nitens]
MAQLGAFSRKGGASPQSPLESNAAFDASDEEDGQVASSTHLLSYSDENAHLLDAPPGTSSMATSAAWSSGAHVTLPQLEDDQYSPSWFVGGHSQEQTLSQLLSRPPGRFAFLCDPVEDSAEAPLRASSLFGALHHALAFDSGGHATHGLQSLTLSIPTFEELPPEDLLDLAAKTNGGTTPFKGRPIEQEDRDVDSTNEPEFERHRAAPKAQADNFEAKEKGVRELQASALTAAESGKSLARWLEAAEQPPAGPLLRTWEFAGSGPDAGGLATRVGPGECLQNGAFLSEAGVATFDRAYRRYASKAFQQAPIIVQERDLVRDALYALQGVPSSLIRLESQARPPQKRGPTPPSVRLLSTSSASISALLKPLIEAGRVRQQLDRFARGKTGPEISSRSADWDEGSRRGLVMQAFGGALQTVLLCQTAALDRIGRSVKERRGGGKLGASNGGAKRTRGRKEAGDEQRFFTKQSAGDETTAEDSISSAGVDAPDGPKGGTRRRRLESFFAAANGNRSDQDREGVQIDPSSSAVRSTELVLSGAEVGPWVKDSDATMLSEAEQSLSKQSNGHLVSNARPSDGVPDASEHLSDGDHGLSGGDRTLTTGSVGDITLLELLLHSTELRTQLHVLARLCKRLGMWDGSGAGGPGVGGAELLSRLFDEVLNADPVSADVHRFLLSAACQPYLELVRGWLYQLQVDDPYREFVLAQSDEVDPLTGTQVVKTASPPSFLAAVWQPLIRAGQQLRVLLDLPQTRELAETILSCPERHPLQTLNLSSADQKPRLGAASLQRLLDAKPAEEETESASPGLVFSASRLRAIAAEARESARKRETEAGWTLTMLAMQERRRKEGKIDAIEQHRLDLAKAYDEQRRASVLETEKEARRKEALFREQREELERRAEAKRRAKAARIERERAMVREEKELEAAEIARVRAAMVAEAEGQLEELDRRIQAVKDRTAVEESQKVDDGTTTLEGRQAALVEEESVKAGDEGAQVEAPRAERPKIDAALTGDTATEEDRKEVQSADSSGKLSKADSSSDVKRGPEQMSDESAAGGDEPEEETASGKGEDDRINLEEWHRLAHLETSESGLFGSEAGESSGDLSTPSGVGGRGTREEEAGGAQGFEGLAEGLTVSAEETSLDSGLRQTRDGTEVRARKDEDAVEPGAVKDVSAILAGLASDLEGGQSGPAGEQEVAEHGESDGGNVQPSSKWGPPEDPTHAAGVAREGLDASGSAGEAARRGRQMEGREMLDVMAGGFDGFRVLPPAEQKDADSGSDLAGSATLVRWGSSADPFPAAGMSTKDLGDSFAAQDFRFADGIDFRGRGSGPERKPETETEPAGDPSFEAGSEGHAASPFKSADEALSIGQPVEDSERRSWTSNGIPNDQETRVLPTETSRQALAFLSPIPSASGDPNTFDLSPTALSTPISAQPDLSPALASSRGVSPGPKRSPPATSPRPKPSGRPSATPDDDDADAPLSVVMDVCVVQEILAQYRCVSACCVHVFQEELALPAHCAALRRYLFMLAGDFADAFMSALLTQRWGPSGGASRQAEVQALLEGSLQTSSCSSDRLAERLHVRVQQSQEELPDVYAPWVKASLTPGGFVDLTRVDAFDFIQLDYRVEWPLTLVLTSAAMAQYQAVFRFLLRAKHATFSLRDVWRDLQILSRRLAKRGPGVSAHVFAEQQRQLREAQLFRAAISHVVTTLASFVQAQISDVAWTRYQERIHTDVVDLHDLSQVHAEYVAEAARACLLGADGAGAKTCIDAIFQQLLALRGHLRRAVRSLDQPAAELEIDEVNQQIKQTKEAFQESLRTLYAVHLRPRVQNVQAIEDLCMRLNFNGFIEESITKLSGANLEVLRQRSAAGGRSE